MEGLTAAVTANQSMLQERLAIEVIKMAAQNQQQLVAVLSQAAQATAANPAHLGNSLDTWA